jgi:catechol 2,3-dioxygenase-like lactoylglutathione lyase family enzyme
MAVRRAMLVIAVPDLERSSAFYRDVLGFEIKEIGDPGWRMYVRDECRIMAGACPDAVPAAQLGDHS